LVWFKWNIEKKQEMYNFTVDTAHTYFVGDGQWLVHNSCRFGPREKLRSNMDIPNGSGTEAHHIVPYDHSNHPLVQTAAEGGWDINGTYNGIELPAPHHYAGHPTTIQ
jgi:hypothetical protein